MTIKHVSMGLAIPTLLSLAAPVSAQSLTLGLGFSDYGNTLAHDSVTVDVEYHAAPFYVGRTASYGLGASARTTREGDLFVGAGIVANWQLANDWFIEGSLMPGFYDEAVDEDRLGGRFFFRSLIGVGRKLPSGDSISLAFSHISNGSIQEFNPGVNALMVRYRIAF